LGKDQEIRGESELRDSRMQRSVAKCASYVAAIEYGAFPIADPEFQKAHQTPHPTPDPDPNSSKWGLLAWSWAL
jgi:hypothetical protein